MQAVGFLLIAFGGWLVDSAEQGRRPVQTLFAIVQNPAAMLDTLDSTKGTGYPSYAPDFGGGNMDDPGWAGGSSSATAPSQAATGSGSPEGVGAVIWARTQIGKPYKWGSKGPSSYDCSGLTQAAYASVGVRIGGNTTAQRLAGPRVSRKDLQVGDLIFPTLGHVQLFSGNGMVVEAPRTGLNVREAPMSGFLMAVRPVPIRKSSGPANGDAHPGGR